jgi:hypothetical protein
MELLAAIQPADARNNSFELLRNLQGRTIGIKGTIALLINIDFNTKRLLGLGDATGYIDQKIVGCNVRNDATIAL